MDQQDARDHAEQQADDQCSGIDQVALGLHRFRQCRYVTGAAFAAVKLRQVEAFRKDDRIAADRDDVTGIIAADGTVCLICRFFGQAFRFVILCRVFVVVKLFCNTCG